MHRILLVIEDYRELVEVQTFLKKVGFDVIGIQKDSTIKKKAIEFAPEIIFIEAQKEKISGLTIDTKIKRYKGFPKVILIFEKNNTKSINDLTKSILDGVIEKPINPETVLNICAKMLNLDSDSLIKKYQRLNVLKESETKLKFDTPKINLFEKTQSEINTRKQILDNVIPAQSTVFQRNIVENNKTELQNSKAEYISNLDKERNDFMTSLLKLAKNK